jgi:hypothetical protein
MDDLFGKAPKLKRADAERIIANQCSGYQRNVAESVVRVASNLSEFTPEDVRLWCEPGAGQENSFSSAILRVVDLKLIKPVRMTRAHRKQAHGRKIPVYCRTFEL